MLRGPLWFLGTSSSLHAAGGKARWSQVNPARKRRRCWLLKQTYAKVGRCCPKWIQWDRAEYWYCFIQSHSPELTYQPLPVTLQWPLWVLTCRPEETGSTGVDLMSALLPFPFLPYCPEKRSLLSTVLTEACKHDRQTFHHVNICLSDTLFMRQWPGTQAVGKKTDTASDFLELMV